MTNTILDTRFKHSSWFKGQKLTVHEALEHLAESQCYYIEPKMKKETDLFNPEYDYYLRYANTKYRSKYKLTQEEMDFFNERSEFYYAKNKSEKERQEQEENSKMIDIKKAYDRLYNSWCYDIKQAQNNINGFKESNDIKHVDLWSKELNFAKVRLQLGMSMFHEYLSVGMIYTKKQYEQFQDDFYDRYTELNLTVFKD